MKRFILLLFLLCNLNAKSNKDLDEYIIDLVNTDIQKAKEFLLDKTTDPYCCYLLGSIFLLEKNLRKADIYITRASNYNIPEALNSLGDGYYSGDIRQKDIKKALYFYIKAAKLGYGIAQFNAGAVYLRHAKTIKDLKKAIYWFNKAYKNKNMHEFRHYIIICKKEAKNEIKKFAKKLSKKY